MARADAPKEATSAASAESGSSESDGPSFEAALGKLEAVVDRLEGGDLELEAALASFEEGVRLTRQCAEQLDAAERRIELLMKDGDAWVARPFAEGAAEGAADPDGDEPEEGED